MKTRIDKEDKMVICINCITGNTEALTFRNGTVINIAEVKNRDKNIPFYGPGLIDLQINGINGIDFNKPSLTVEDMVTATHYLLSNGVTTFFPTVITNSDENILKILSTIYKACLSDPLVYDCIGGIHLEGPFISPQPGAKGAHDEQYIQPPDWELFKKFQTAAGGKIKIITLAPEWENSCAFIQNCREHNVLVSIGHSMANSEQINSAIHAGASLSTHLGNAVPLLLPRHPNMIWDQLAAEELSACIITDGIHVPDSFIKVVMKVKGKTAIIVSDATCFAGMPPGEYQNHIGGTVVLDEEKRVSLKSIPGLLAGAAKSLLENVQTLINRNLSTLSDAWQMASTNVVNMLVKKDNGFSNSNEDMVLFQVNNGAIYIQCVIKKGKIVFEQ